MKIEDKPRVSHLKLTLLLFLIVGFFLGTMLYILKQSNANDTSKKHNVVSEETQTDEEETTQEEETSSICVLKALDLEAKTMILYNIDQDCTVKLSYTGGTDLRDEYSQVISASQLVVGELVDAIYNESTLKLTSLMNSTNTWEYTNVTNFSPDRTNKVVKLYGEKYKYTSKLFVVDADGESTLLSINTDDVLTVRGYGKTIYSIRVTKGHGSLRLENCEYFEGGKISINGTEYVEFTSDTIFTVREGKAKIEMEKGDVLASTTVEVLRNQEVVVDLSSYAPNPEETGIVTFVISPFGAELFIDDSLTSYANPVTLSYGEHFIEVELDGYESYKGTYELSTATDIVQIELVKTNVEDDDSITSDSSSSTTDSTTNNTTGSSNSTTNSTGNTTGSTTGDTSGNTTGNTTGSTTDSGTSGTTGSNTNTESSSSSESTDTSQNTTDTSDTSGSESAQSEEDSTTEDESETVASTSNVDADHTITVNSPEGASVYINGIYKGIVPITLEKPLGITYITLLKEGYEQITHTVNISDDDENRSFDFPNLVLQEDN